MLEKIRLPEQYTTGHSGIDDQHAHLFSILMGFVEKTKNAENENSKKIESEIQELIAALNAYTQNHFQYEERMMKRAKYPQLEQHQILHQSFIEKIVEAQRNSMNKKEKRTFLKEISMFLKEWYLNHILVEDKKLVVFLKVLSGEEKVGLLSSSDNPSKL